MNDSILTSVKKILGITEEYEQFDHDIITHINSVFMILFQLGVGPSPAFTISDKSAIWTDFITEGSSLDAVKSYVPLKVRMMFDPPLSSSVAEALNRQIAEFEWRLNVAVDPVDTFA